MTARPPKPPAHVEPWVRALGPELAVEFLMTFGGADLYIPRAGGGRSRLEEVVGREGVERLAAVAHELPRRVPVARDWLARVLREKGLPVAEVARRLRVTDWTVRRILSGESSAADPDTRQPRLL